MHRDATKEDDTNSPSTAAAAAVAVFVFTLGFLLPADDAPGGPPTAAAFLALALVAVDVGLFDPVLAVGLADGRLEPPTLAVAGLLVAAAVVPALSLLTSASSLLISLFDTVDRPDLL